MTDSAPTNIHDIPGCLDHASSVIRGRCACATCGKLMDPYWDTVCHACGATLCYFDSRPWDGYWYCQECNPAARKVSLLWWWIALAVGLTMLTTSLCLLYLKLTHL